MADEVLNQEIQNSEQVNTENSEQQNQEVVNQSAVEDIGSLKSQWEEKEKSYTQTLQEREAELNKYRNDYFTLIDHYDGKNVFANEQIRKQNEILKKFPDKDPNVISAIASKDVNSLSGNEALVLADKLSIGSIAGVTDNDRLAGILKNLGLEDVDLSTLEGKDKYFYEVAVSKAKQQLQDLVKNGVSDNSQFDIETVKKARTEQLTVEKETLAKKWTPVNETLLKAFDGYKQQIKDEKGNVLLDYTYKADDKFKQEYSEELRDVLLNAGLQPTQENYQVVYNLINERFAINHLDKIVNDVAKQVRTQMEKEFHDKVHNDKPTQKGLNQATNTQPEGRMLTGYFKK